MHVISDEQRLRQHSSGPVCVLAEPDQQELIRQAASLGGLELPDLQHRHRRPRAAVEKGQAAPALMVLQDQREHRPVQIVSNDDVSLLVGHPEDLAVVRPAVEASPEHGRAGLVAAVTAVAQQAEDALERIDDDSRQLGDETLGFASAARRRELGRLRAELFRLGETQAAHRNMLIAHDDLSDLLEQQHRSRLNQAAATFGANQSTATRLYAMDGDVLDEQATVVSERLTVVATIFLPLTLATGFFGMNFQRMLDRLDSLASFLLLGLLARAVLTVLTVFGPRLLNRQT